MSTYTWKDLPLFVVMAMLVAGAATFAVVTVARMASPLPLSITQTTTQKMSAFSVTGKSTITSVPDKAEVSIGVSQKGTSLKQTQSQVNQVMNTIKDKLLQMGVKKEDIKTTAYSIYPNYDYSMPGNQRVLGYSVDAHFTVGVTDFDKLNELIDMATASGATSVGGVQFTLSEARLRELTQQARAEAVEDAKRNARELANLSGIRLGRIIDVSESSGGGRPIMPMMAMAKMDAAESAPTSVEPGTSEFAYSVTLSYETN